MNAVAAGFQVIQVGDIRVTYVPDGMGVFAYDVFPGTPAECRVGRVMTGEGRRYWQGA